GTAAMQEIAGTIFEGAMAFLRRQYQTIAILALVTAVVIAIVVGIFETTDQTTRGVLAGIGFIAGALCSGISGFIGMYIAVKANLRTAAAAQHSPRDAITVSLRGGAVSGFLVTALSRLGVSAIFAVYSRILVHSVAATP